MALPKGENTSRADTAFHEAAHAVIAHRLGFLLGRVTIRPDESRLGYSVSEGAWADGSRDRDQALVYLAGLAGGRLMRPDSSIENGGAADDYENARELIGEAALPDAENEAARLVELNKDSIFDLATALLRDGTLDDEEAAVVIEARDDGEHWDEQLTYYRERRRLLRGW